MFSGLHELVSLNITILKPSSSNGGDIWYAAGPIAVLIMASFVYSSYKNKKELNIGSYADASTESAEASTNPFDRSDDEISWTSASADNDEIVLEADAKYAEELQIQEALLASMFASQRTNSASSSTYKERSSLSSLLKKNDIWVSDPQSQIMCKICLENQESWQMFRNSTCCHSFCYDCTRKHATTKIQENINSIPCPGLNCKSTLDFNSLRRIIPKDTLIKWDELLCQSMILESHKLYCPFSDCSVLLINDDKSISKIDCPACRRSICAVCRVPWHSEFSCKEFGKFKKKNKGKKDEEMVVAIAKKKKWKKCPSCKFFVEKAEGCVHITCRCGYEFCYNCGAKWTSTHGGCRSRS